MRSGAKGMYTIAVMGLLAVTAMVAMYWYGAEKLLPPSSEGAKKTIDLLTTAFPVDAYGTVEGTTFRVTYVPRGGGRLADAEARAEMEKIGRFVETQHPEPLTEIFVVREAQVPSGCSHETARTELRVVPQKRTPKK